MRKNYPILSVIFHQNKGDTGRNKNDHGKFAALLQIYELLINLTDAFHFCQICVDDLSI